MGSCEGKPPPQRVVCSPTARSPRSPGVCVAGDAASGSQVSLPLAPLCRSQAQRPEAPARPVSQGQGHSCLAASDGAGPMPQMEPTASHAPQVSHQLGTPGTSSSPHTPPRFPTSSRDPGHLLLSGDPRGARVLADQPGPAAPPAGTLWSQAGPTGQVPRAGAGDPVGRVSPGGHGQLRKHSPLPERLRLWSIFWPHGKLVICLRDPHLHSLLRQPGRARSEGREVHPGGLLHLQTCRRGLSSQLPHKAVASCAH